MDPPDAKLRRSAEVGWRAAVDSLRPYSHSLWQGMTHDEQRRFLRHARPWWDVHRHRIAPEVAGIVAGMVAASQLEVVAARIVSAREVPEGVEVEYRRRGAVQSRTETFAYVFNCTGPLHSITATRRMATSSNPSLRGKCPTRCAKRCGP